MVMKLGFVLFFKIDLITCKPSFDIGILLNISILNVIYFSNIYFKTFLRVI